MYPPETVVAEKLQAAVVLGMTNSRMKDYYDLWVILRSYDLSDESLAKAIAATFNRRQTPLPEDMPPGISEEFGKAPPVQRLWREFLRRQRIDDAPNDFSKVVSALQKRLWPIMIQARMRD